MPDKHTDVPEAFKQHRSVDERLDALEQDQDPLHGVTKAAVKEAIKEWLDDQFAKFGKWTFNSILAAALAAAIYFILVQQGWKHSP